MVGGGGAACSGATTNRTNKVVTATSQEAQMGFMSGRNTTNFVGRPDVSWLSVTLCSHTNKQADNLAGSHEWSDIRDRRNIVRSVPRCQGEASSAFVKAGTFLEFPRGWAMTLVVGQAQRVWKHNRHTTWPSRGRTQPSLGRKLTVAYPCGDTQTNRIRCRGRGWGPQLGVRAVISGCDS